MHPDLENNLRELVTAAPLDRIMEVLHKRLARHGEPKGRVDVRTREEADALEDLFGKRVGAGGTVALKELDAILREGTIFHCSLHEAVLLHRGGKPIVHAKAEKAQSAAAQDRAVRRCFQLLPELGLSPRAHLRVAGWMHAQEKDLRAGFRRWGEKKLLAAVRAVALAFGKMPEQGGPPLFLAELATDVANDAKVFDAGRPGGTLLFRALAHEFPGTAARERRGSAAWKANLLSEAGIARDPVSVRVDTFGLMGDLPHLQELRRAGLSRAVNLDDLPHIRDAVRCYQGFAFIVENPTVFAALFRHVRERYVVLRHPTIICTNGNLNLADWGLLDALRQTGAHLFYCGDYDVRGLEIATALIERFPDSVSPWRMTRDDYLSTHGDEHRQLDGRALDRVARHFPDLTREMRIRGHAADQESLIPALKDDLDRFVLKGITPPRRGDAPGSASRSLNVGR
ncbi:MAG: DUF2399 domain-containing protein [Gemmatimonadetes bacterium]|nr:DUF2399 domain-containing protein [Gemmatimonadota bacterium]